MKQQTFSFLAAFAVLASVGTAHAQQPVGGSQITVQTAPGKGVATRTHQLVATIEAVDAAQRQVTLKGPKGQRVSLSAGPDVRNLEQVKVGDRVTVVYAEALSLELKKGGKALRGSTEAADGARAAQGERPAGIVAEQVTVTADVTAVDAKAQRVTLRGPRQTVDLYVADPAQLKLIKVGDQVEAVYTQALALSVDPVAPATK